MMADKLPYSSHIIISSYFTAARGCPPPNDARPDHVKTAERGALDCAALALMAQAAAAGVPPPQNVGQYQQGRSRQSMQQEDQRGPAPPAARAKAEVTSGSLADVTCAGIAHAQPSAGAKRQSPIVISDSEDDCGHDSRPQRLAQRQRRCTGPNEGLPSVASAHTPAGQRLSSARRMYSVQAEPDEVGAVSAGSASSAE